MLGDSASWGVCSLAMPSLAISTQPAAPSMVVPSSASSAAVPPAEGCTAMVEFPMALPLPLAVGSAPGAVAVAAAAAATAAAAVAAAATAAAAASACQLASHTPARSATSVGWL